MSLTKDQIIEAVASMSVMEVVELINAMEKKFGVSAAVATATTANSTSGDISNNANSEEKTEFSLFLKSIGSNKIAVIKAVRSITGLGLKEAKDLVESSPSLLKEDLSKNDAETLKKSLEEIGAEVEIK